MTYFNVVQSNVPQYKIWHNLTKSLYYKCKTRLIVSTPDTLRTPLYLFLKKIYIMSESISLSAFQVIANCGTENLCRAIIWKALVPFKEKGRAYRALFVLIPCLSKGTKHFARLINN